MFSMRVLSLSVLHTRHFSGAILKHKNIIVFKHISLFSYRTNVPYQKSDALGFVTIIMTHGC